MVFPFKLKKGDELRVIAPSTALLVISEETRSIADSHLGKLGLSVSVSKHAEEKDEFFFFSY